MEVVNEKLSKQENGLTRLLRKLLRQKDEIIRQVKIENVELKELVLKQQELLMKLNDENTKLAMITESDGTKDNREMELMECNRSLKDQLLISQNQNSVLLHDFEKAKKEIKYLNKKLSKYCN